jgi:predicted TPR repeat methyltransferase
MTVGSGGIEGAVIEDTDTDPPTKRVEISVDEAMAIAVDCMKHGRFRDADAICRAMLELEPGHPDALHYSGVLAHKRGNNEEAIALIQQSLERVPEQPDWYSNLGIVLQANGQFEAAMEAFRRAILLNPAHENAHNNLGVLLRLFGRLEESEASYRAVIALNPDHPDVYFNLAVVLDQTGRATEALTAYCKAITLRPSHPEAHRHLALAYSVIGETQKAIEACEEWVRNSPKDPRARHALAAYSGRDVPARASDEYVKKVFDDFAESFEAKLARLEYRAPALVGDAVAAAVSVADGTLDVLDVGCGTGLCGPLLAPYAKRLVGVDLSAGMLKLAREKQVYDELTQAELTEYLQEQRDRFDVIVTADTLVYFGALEPVAAAAATALRPGGVFVFTVEEETEPDLAASYALRPHGRYTHGEEYVRRVLLDVGLQPHIGRGELRLESGLPVAGLVVRAAKPGVAGTAADAGLAIGEPRA